MPTTGLLLLTMIVLYPLNASSREAATFIAPDSTPVTIYRDDFGVPHIVGDTEVGVFYGQGFAVAQDRLYQLELNRRTAEGKLSEWFGPLTVEFDKEIRTLFYTEEERAQQFDLLPCELKSMLEAYRDGINTYLDSMAANPQRYRPLEFADLEMEPWTVTKSIAVMQYISRSFGQFGGAELNRLNELQTFGREWFDNNRPINDPSAPTTIPIGGLAESRSWRYSGLRVRSEVVRSLERRQSEMEAVARRLHLPGKFGSFAVLISGSKSNSGYTMLLGCPQMGPPRENEVNIANEVELECRTFHVGGMSIAGIPLVIIGHTPRFAWTLTSGLSDNSDVYIDSTLDDTYRRYFFDGNWLKFETIRDTISSLGNPIPFTHYRTVHGPVFSDDLTRHQVYSMKMTFWGEELDMAAAILSAIKADNVVGFESAISMSPMSFNIFYAGKDSVVKYWHAGLYQDRSDGVDPRLPHRGDGSEEWGGFIDFADLPADANHAQGYYVNWNNKPVSWWNNGDNIPWVGWHPVNFIDNYVGPISDFTFDNLKDVPRQISDHGTYQQAIEFPDPKIVDENILPPGQSGFVSLTGERSPHYSDQWPLHLDWEFKDMEFGGYPRRRDPEHP